MRDQEDQMDVGSAGRTRGQGHVRIPQRRINQSLRSGVSPSMNQMTGPQGHFQSSPGHMNYMPMRPSKPNYGQVYQAFRKNATRGVREFRGVFQDHQPHPGDFRNRFNTNQQQFENNRQHVAQLIHGQEPPMRLPGIPGRGVPSIPGRFPGGDVGHLPQPGGPILGNGQQTVKGLLQAIMGDIGQGFTPDQYAALQAGNLPGQEHGDFARGLGFGAGNDSVLKQLAQYLVQNTDGSYHMSAYGQDPMQQLLQQAIHGQNPQMPFHGPPAPPGPPGFPPPGRGGYGTPIPPGGYHPMPLGGRRTMQRGSGYLPPNLMQGLMGG